MSVGELVLDGPLLVALAVAVAAGLVSFASPCVLPLVPGYLGYVSGMAGAGQQRPARGRLVAGVALFVAGFTVVFVAFGVLAGSLGATLVRWADPLTRGLGVLVIGMGLVFLGWLPFQRTARPRWAPAAGLWGAPVLGVVFALGWTPCIGPTLVAVYTLALDSASAGRGALLSVAYCLGLGLPFLLLALGLSGAFLRRHRLAIMRVGGGLLVLVGVALVTGLWGRLTGALSGWIGGFETVL